MPCTDRSTGFTILAAAVILGASIFSHAALAYDVSACKSHCADVVSNKRNACIRHCDANARLCNERPGTPFCSR